MINVNYVRISREYDERRVIISGLTTYYLPFVKTFGKMFMDYLLS